MDLINAAIGMGRAQTFCSIQYSVARKVLDMQQMQGDAAIKLIEAASRGINHPADALTVAATGLGGELDIIA